MSIVKTVKKEPVYTLSSSLKKIVILKKGYQLIFFISFNVTADKQDRHFSGRLMSLYNGAKPENHCIWK